MADERWITDEPRFAWVVRQVIARAMRRPLRVLAVTLLLTAAYLAVRATRAPAYQSSLHFRLSEGDLSDPGNAPRPPSEIIRYVRDVVLSRELLGHLMEKYRLSGAYLEKNREAAIDEFRDDLVLEVSRNYFIFDRGPSEGPRSAQVSISLRGPDPDKIRAVLGEIGAAIEQDQKRHRNARLAGAGDLVEEQVARARARVMSLRDAKGRLWLELSRSDPRRAAGVRAKIASLEGESSAALEQLLALQQLATEVKYSSAAEGDRLGLTFELFDQSQVAITPPLKLAALLKRAALAFALTLIPTAVVLGSFDDRLYTVADVTERGLPLFGGLPRWPGDDAGSLNQRRSA